MNLRRVDGGLAAPRTASRRIGKRVAAETALAVVGSGTACFLVYLLLGLPIPASGPGGIVMIVAPLATPLLVAPFVAAPFARSSQRIADLLAEVQQAKRTLTEEIAERVLVQYRLEELARRDPLTGLLNRRGFFELAGERAERDLAVMVVDVDDFKQVNDRFGHAAGDAVLGAIATALEGSAGEAQVARMGGDEFVLLADAADAADLSRVAERVAALPVTLPDGPRATVACSVGTATLAAGDSVDAALAAADAEMYAAKSRRASPGGVLDGDRRTVSPTRRQRTPAPSRSPVTNA